MKKLLQYINLKDLVTNVAAAAIILTLAACGGTMGVLPLPGSGNSRAVHIATAQRSGSHIFPGEGTKPFLAGFFTMFQTTAPAGTRLQQSYDAVCNFQSSFLAIVPSGSLVPLAMAGENNSCSFFSSPQGDGKETMFDGTLNALVVTGKTVGGVSFECRDVDTTSPIADHSFTRAYLDPNAHIVEVFNGANGTSTKVPFTCTGIGTDTDQVATIEAQWAKI